MASNNPTPIKTMEATICAIKHAWPGRKQIFEVAHTAQVTNINKYYVYITVRVSGTQLICSSENMVFSLHWFCKSLPLFGGTVPQKGVHLVTFLLAKSSLGTMIFKGTVPSFSTLTPESLQPIDGAWDGWNEIGHSGITWHCLFILGRSSDILNSISWILFEVILWNPLLLGHWNIFSDRGKHCYGIWTFTT